MTNKKVDQTLMEAGEEAFWKEFDRGEGEEERYYVVDKSTGDVIVENARLTKKRKRVKV